MAAPPTIGSEAGYVSGTITAYKTNYPAPGRSQIAVIHSGDSDGPSLFANGKLEISGIGTYAVTNSWSLRAQFGMSRTVVAISGVPPGNLTNLTVKLYDDDDQYLADDPLYPSYLALQSPPLPALALVGPFIQAAQPKFAAAYVTLVDANAQGWNTQSTVPFKRQEPASSVFGTVFDSGNLQLKGQDHPEFWAFSVVFGYESSFPDDGDPDRYIPLSGVTPKTSRWLIVDPNRALGYSAIFLEAIRDYEFAMREASNPSPGHFVDPIRVPFIRDRYLQRIYAVVAHEVGHGPGRQHENTDHGEKGIMEAGASALISGDAFALQTIRRFRSAQSWTR
jgi:hypothetical protein